MKRDEVKELIFCVLLYGGMAALVFGKFLSAVTLIIIGGTAAAYITFGWLFSAAEADGLNWKIASMWIGAFIVWLICHYILVSMKML